MMMWAGQNTTQRVVHKQRNRNKMTFVASRKRAELVVATVLGFALLAHLRHHQCLVGVTTKTTSSVLKAKKYNTRFQLENLDLNTSSPCGGHKCFYRLKSSKDIGYLVANVNTQSKEDFVKQWETTKSLEAKYAISHFLLEPPVLMNITQQFADAISSKIFRATKPKKHIKVFSTFIIYQKVRVAPTPNVLFGCAPDKKKLMTRSLTDFLKNIQNKVRFTKHVEKEMARSSKLFQKVPWLARDFQVMIDENGKFYHVDVCTGPSNKDYKDRKNRTTSDWGTACEKAFREFLKELNNAIQ
jgi:ribosome-associated translation inhibitor RaiA